MQDLHNGIMLDIWQNRCPINVLFDDMHQRLTGESGDVMTLYREQREQWQMNLKMKLENRI